MRFQDGRLRVSALLTAETLGQMRRHITPAAWIIRSNGQGEVETLDPAQHGQVTGSLCDFLSHPSLIRDLGLAAQVELSHFVGTVVRLEPETSLTLQHPRFPLALLINLSDEVFAGWSLNPGDAEVVDLRAGQRVRTPRQPGSTMAIDGYFIARR